MPQTNTADASASMRSQILAAMLPDTYQRPAEIAARSGIERGKLSYQLGQMLANGLIVSQGETSQRKYRRRDPVELAMDTSSTKVEAKKTKVGSNSTKVAAKRPKSTPPKTKVETITTVHVRGGHILATIEDLIARREMIDAALAALRAL